MPYKLPVAVAASTFHVRRAVRILPGALDVHANASGPLPFSKALQPLIGMVIQNFGQDA